MNEIIGIRTLLAFVCVGIPVGLIVTLVVISINRRRRLEALAEHYDECLGMLRRFPKGQDNRELRIQALQAGRAFADEARRQAGDGEVAIFDEVALQNDLSVYSG